MEEREIDREYAEVKEMERRAAGGDWPALRWLLERAERGERERRAEELAWGILEKDSRLKGGGGDG